MTSRAPATIALVLAAVAGVTRADQPIAFVGARVVPLDREVVLDDRTVLVRGDRIVKIGAAGKIELPDDTRTIDAAGGYLMPGLADMHVHVWCEGDLLLYVANGVTTIRNMSGAPLHLEWRERIASGDLLGPTLYSTGPIIDGNAPEGRANVETPDQARAVVAEQKRAGYDFLKVYNRLSVTAYDAVLAAAREHDMPVVGHLPYAVSLEHALAAGQRSFEHLQGFGMALEAEPPTDGANPFVRDVRGWEHGEHDRIPALAKSVVEAGAWICPTLVVNDARLAPPEVARAALGRPEMRFVFPPQLREWKQAEGHAETFRSFRASDGVRDRMTKAVWDAGQHVLLGTDTANPFLIPGFSIHRELAHLVEAGLTPYEALRTGTHNAAEFLGGLDEFGAVAEGLRADMILLDADPLQDVGNLRKRVGVMVRGRWYPEAELQKRLDELAASY